MPAWTPANLPSGQAAGYWDSSDTATITDTASFVSQFDDKTGNGNHMVQPVGGNQVRTGQETVNGLNVLTLASGSDFLKTLGSLFNFESATIYAVGRRAPAGNDSGGLVGTKNIDGKWLWFWARDNWSTRVIHGSLVSTTLSTSLAVIGAILDGANHTSRVNGHEKTGANTAAGAAGAFHIGLALSDYYQYEGVFCESLVCNVPLSLENQQRYEGYTAHKWGFASELETNHPYRNAPPQIASTGETYNLATTIRTTPVVGVSTHLESSETVVVSSPMAVSVAQNVECFALCNLSLSADFMALSNLEIDSEAAIPLALDMSANDNQEATASASVANPVDIGAQTVVVMAAPAVLTAATSIAIQDFFGDPVNVVKRYEMSLQMPTSYQIGAAVPARKMELKL